MLHFLIKKLINECTNNFVRAHFLEYKASEIINLFVMAIFIEITTDMI